MLETFTVRGQRLRKDMKPESSVDEDLLDGGVC